MMTRRESVSKNCVPHHHRSIGNTCHCHVRRCPGRRRWRRCPCTGKIRVSKIQSTPTCFVRRASWRKLYHSLRYPLWLNAALTTGRLNRLLGATVIVEVCTLEYGIVLVGAEE